MLFNSCLETENEIKLRIFLLDQKLGLLRYEMVENVTGNNL